MPTQREIARITAEIEREFPQDHALQQVHIARRIIALEAKENGMDYMQYVRWLMSKKNKPDSAA